MDRIEGRIAGVSVRVLSVTPRRGPVVDVGALRYASGREVLVGRPWLVLLLAGCAYRPGHVGDWDCTPYLPAQDRACSVWQCYKVGPDGTVEEWYAWGVFHKGQFSQATTRCTDAGCLEKAATFAINEACGAAS